MNIVVTKIISYKPFYVVNIKSMLQVFILWPLAKVLVFTTSLDPMIRYKRQLKQKGKKI